MTLIPAPPPPPLSQATADEVAKPESRAYRPHGSARRLMTCRDNEVLMSGPAGTGKSRSCLEKLHLAAQNYPGMRGLIVRKTRESLTEAALVTFEMHVVEPGAGILEAGGQRRMRQAYVYPNGSVIVVGGLDKPGKVMSTEYDLIYAQEAIELTETDWESLTTRLRNGKMPYNQIVADTNPDAPSHWLRRRCESGQTTLIECRHEDNPVLFDAEAKAWTPRGEAYIDRLDALTGPRKQRLRFGRWVQAEGVVYEEWNAAIHLIDRFEIPADWRRFVSIDFGYTNPFVAQFWALDPDDRMYLWREIYRTGRLVEDHAATIRDVLAEDGGAPVVGMVCDHDAEGRATLCRHLERGNFAAKKEVADGIQRVAARLRVAGDGKPRLFIMRDSLVGGADPRLLESMKPTHTAAEFDGYIWDSASRVALKGEFPIKLNDHGLDALRYGVRFADDLAAGFQVNGSDPRESILATLPPGTFAASRDRFASEDGGVLGDIMNKVF